MGKKGQAVLSEHVMVFFMVIAAIVGVTTLVQRGLEARIHDARNFVVDSVNSVCDADCQAAAGNAVRYEYEPYYSQMLSDVQHNEENDLGTTRGNSEVIGAIYYKNDSGSTKTISTSVQLPPQCADGTGPKPAYCAN